MKPKHKNIGSRRSVEKQRARARAPAHTDTHVHAHRGTLLTISLLAADLGHAVQNIKKGKKKEKKKHVNFLDVFCLLSHNHGGETATARDNFLANLSADGQRQVEVSEAFLRRNERKLFPPPPTHPDE